MKVKLDENLGALGEPDLRAAGIDVATVGEEGLASCADRTVLEVSRLEGRCLLTLDLDFSNPLVHPPAQTAGIVVLRLPDPFQVQHLSAAIATFVAAARSRSPAGRLWIVEVDRVREYAPESDDREPP